jgi:sugar phosphate isomerase/epimerase
MKFSIRENMVPGRTLKEKFDNLVKLGFKGIEITRSSRREHLEEIQRAAEATGICPNIFSSQHLGILDARRSERDEAMRAIKEAMQLCGELGGVGVILPPLIEVHMHGKPRIPDLSPLFTTRHLERQLLIELLKELGEHGEKVRGAVVIEALNRYEQPWPCTLQEATEICEAVQSPAVVTMADFFHMNIEDADVAESIRHAGRWVRNVHLADSNRWLPGYGHTDFGPGLRALKEVGYDLYYGFECRVTGDPMAELKKSADYIRGKAA